MRDEFNNLYFGLNTLSSPEATRQTTEMRVLKKANTSTTWNEMRETPSYTGVLDQKSAFIYTSGIVYGNVYDSDGASLVHVVQCAVTVLGT
jgi:hypothetical protein